MNLSITAEKVKEAASKCPQAEATLKTLFPEVFEKAAINIAHFTVDGASDKLVFIGKDIAPAGLYNKCLVLNQNYEWEIKPHTSYSGNEYTLLIPRKK